MSWSCCCCCCFCCCACVQLIKSCNTPEEQNLAYVTLCNRMLSQCEVQVLRIGSFAFPLAYVCVAVGAAVPQFMELLMAKLQHVGGVWGRRSRGFGGGGGEG
jgi:hypothetical protein